VRDLIDSYCQILKEGRPEGAARDMEIRFAPEQLPCAATSRGLREQLTSP
jgi:hypothetical protein